MTKIAKNYTINHQYPKKSWGVTLRQVSKKVYSRARKKAVNSKTYAMIICAFAFLAAAVIGYLIIVFGKHDVKVATAQPVVRVERSLIITPSASVSAKIVSVVIKKTDSLQKIFKRNGLDPKDAAKILALKSAHDLTGLRSGKKINLSVDPVSKKLQQLTYAPDDLTTITVENKNGFYAQIQRIEPVAKVEYASAAINGSIYNSGAKAGIPRKIVAQLTKVFSCKIKMFIKEKVRLYDRTLRNAIQLRINHFNVSMKLMFFLLLAFGNRFVLRCR